MVVLVDSGGYRRPRLFKVIKNGIQIERLYVISAQNSAIGLTLFVLSTADLVTLVRSFGLPPHLCDDDTQIPLLLSITRRCVSVDSHRCVNAVASWMQSIIIIIIIISLLKTHVRRTCLHSKNITMKHTRVILCYATDSYIGCNLRIQLYHGGMELGKKWFTIKWCVSALLSFPQFIKPNWHQWKSHMWLRHYTAKTQIFVAEFQK